MSGFIATSPTHTCPCCPHDLLRHVRATGVYWFCPHCYQEMPTIEEEFDWLKDERQHLEIAARLIEKGQFKVVATNLNRDRQQFKSRGRDERSKVIVTSRL